jgi:hypothetical protein
MRKRPTVIVRDLRQDLFIDGIRYAAEMARFAYTDLEERLPTIPVHPTENDELISFAPSLLSAWSVVDHIFRLGGLFERIPNIKQNVFSARDHFRQFSSTAEHLRNGIQHLSNERILELAEDPNPVWGTLSWYVIEDSSTGNGFLCQMIPGKLDGLNHQVSINPADIAVRENSIVIMLTAFGVSLNLTDAMTALRAALAQLRILLKGTGKSLVKDASDAFISLQVVRTGNQAIFSNMHVKIRRK